MGSLVLLRSELMTRLSTPSKPPDRLHSLPQPRLTTSPTLPNTPEPPDPPDPPDLQAPSLILFSDSKPFHHRWSSLTHILVGFILCSDEVHLTSLHRLLPPHTLRPVLFYPSNIGVVTSTSSGAALSGILPVIFLKLGLCYFHLFLGFPLWSSPCNTSSAPFISTKDRISVLCFGLYWFEFSSVLTERSCTSPTPSCVRGLNADLLSSPLGWEMLIISPSSFGKERSTSPSSRSRERTFPHLPFSMRSGFFSAARLSKLFNILIVLLSCVCTGPEDATGLASSNSGDRSWFLTSQSNVTRLQQSGSAVISLLTHLSFASNSLSNEELSILISSFLMLYGRGLRGWIIPSYDCNTQV